jgi:hypothetical protein
MEGDPTIGQGTGWALHSVLDIMFRWVPATIMTFTETSPYPNPDPIRTPITDPVSTTDVVNFLQMASPAAFDEIFRQWAMFVAISIMLSLLFGVACLYCGIRIWQVRQNEREKRLAFAHTVAATDVPKTQLRWNRVMEQIESDDEQQWRLAILESDIMLNELLDVQGLKGETMADKLKQANRTNFRTIDLAWEAHLVRNKIAHESQHTPLESREARRTINLYEQVFREFQFVQ